MICDKKCRTGVRITGDILLIILLHVVYFAFKAFGGNKWAFSCEDNSIRYTYKPNTISTLAVAIYGYSIPLLTIIVVELMIAVYQFYKLKEKDSFREFGILIYKLCIAALIAQGITFFITTLTKYTLGRLRPHFLEICKPDAFKPDCTGIQSVYKCQGQDQRLIHDSFLSFLSGHSSTATTGVLFTVLYLQTRLQLSFLPMIRPLLQFGLFASLIYICCTRITDHYHHATDVVGGVILGTLCTLFSFFWYMDKGNVGKLNAL